MAQIQFINDATNTGTTLTYPTGINAGDYIVYYGYRTATTAPSLPTGFTNTSSPTASANGNSERVCYKVAAGTESGTTSATFTNATQVTVVVYRHVIGVGTSAVTTHASGTNSNLPALTLQGINAGSWVVGFSGSAQGTSQSTPAGVTKRAELKNGTASMVDAYDTNGGVSSFSAMTVTLGTAANNASATVELLGNPDFPPVQPTLSSPSNGATGQSTLPIFQWSDTDPDSDTITYEAQVLTVAPTVIYLTSASTGLSWTVPGDWNNSNNTIEVIGGGAGGSNGFDAVGGGGGGFGRVSNLTLSGSISYQIGTGGSGGASGSGNNNGGAGGDSWFNGTAVVGSSVGAKGAPAPQTASPFEGMGGSAVTSVGDVKYAGGTSFGATSGVAVQGGGGAAGPEGQGGNSGMTAGTSAVPTGGNGGGGNGGGAKASNATSTSGSAGGNNILGAGAGSGSTSSASAGGAGSAGGGGGGGFGSSTNTQVTAGGAGGTGTEWSASYGSGGGGGGAGSTSSSGGAVSVSGGAGATYGAGGGAGGQGSSSYGAGGNGAQGIIVITYVPSTATTIDAFSASGGHDALQFADLTNPLDTDPFPSGDSITFTVPSLEILTSGTTYYWRIRGKDPSGTNQYGFWSPTYSFTTTGGSTPTITYITYNPPFLS